MDGESLALVSPKEVLIPAVEQGLQAANIRPEMGGNVIPEVRRHAELADARIECISNGRIRLVVAHIAAARDGGGGDQGQGSEAAVAAVAGSRACSAL